MFERLFYTLTTDYFNEAVALLIILCVSLTFIYRYFKHNGTVCLILKILIILLLFLIFSLVSYRDDLLGLQYVMSMPFSNLLDNVL